MAMGPEPRRDGAEGGGGRRVTGLTVSPARGGRCNGRCSRSRLGVNGPQALTGREEAKELPVVPRPSWLLLTCPRPQPRRRGREGKARGPAGRAATPAPPGSPRSPSEERRLLLPAAASSRFGKADKDFSHSGEVKLYEIRKLINSILTVFSQTTVKGWRGGATRGSPAYKLLHSQSCYFSAVSGQLYAYFPIPFKKRTIEIVEKYYLQYSIISH